ncbi:hypothetical protein CKAH01_14447 [Colletotrichum kahawae]|uniref:Transcription factor domain-containing protein n=1 Tax=Colletotrichum kahawae TaxID=34407 RepID=A0AAD9YLW5_COLKA|nr:hypothetical protein CKAH01_14447 [Colletotrichum kahawae]
MSSQQLDAFEGSHAVALQASSHFFLAQPYLGAIYVSEIEISRLYQEVALEGVADPAKRALVFASMAIGSLNCSKSSRSSPTTSNDGGGSSHYQDALLAVEKMLYSRRAEQTSCVLGLCVSCAQALRLNSMAAIRQLCQTDSEIDQLRQAFWLLYCIEKAFRMRSGQFSSLSDAFIDHNPLTECDKTGVTATSRDFHAHYRLSQLCSQHIVAQFASEVLNVIVNMDPSTTNMNRHFVQVAVGSFCITAAFAHLHLDQATIFNQLVSTLGLFARVSTTSSVVSLGKLSSVVDCVQRLITPDTQRSAQSV